MDNINTFEVSKSWFSYVAENVNVKPIHTALYFFIFNKWNSLFWKKHFGLPTENTMECLNIRSYKTYIKALEELESFGFIKFIERSKNQNTSNIIEVVNNTKANIKATTKALLKATTQSECQSNDQSTASVIKQYNKEQINQLTKNHIEVKKFLQTLSTTTSKIEDRKLKFLEKIKEVVKGTEHESNKDELNNFYGYWTEHGDNDKKMRFEKEKSFSVSRRLSTWFKNNFNGNKNKDPYANWDKKNRNYGTTNQQTGISKQEDAAIGLAKRVAQRHFEETGDRIPYEQFLTGGN